MRLPSVLLAGAIMLSGCLGIERETPGATAARAPYEVVGDFETGANGSRVLTPGPYALLPEEVATIDAPDGVGLSVGLVRPDVPDGTQVPVILHASAYRYANEAGNLRSRVSGSPLPSFLIDNFVPHGYAVALLNVRGYGGSGGCIDFFGEQDLADMDATITWLATQPWSNGNVGMIGISYDTMMQWTAAATGNPHLRAIVPQAGAPDLYTEVVRNGTPMALVAMGGPLFLGLSVAERANAAGAERLLDTPECAPVLAARMDALASTLETGARVPAEFWAARDHRASVAERYTGGILLVQGFRDQAGYPHTQLPFGQELADAGIDVAQLLGQFGHTSPDLATGRTPRFDYAEMLLRFYDRWLKDDATAPILPRVQVADNARSWRTEDAWPPRDARWERLHLGAGSLGAEPSGESASTRVALSPEWSAQLVTDEATESACRGCARFETEPLGEALRFAGLPQLHVNVTPSAPRAILVAQLYVADGDTTTLVTSGVMDLRFREGGEEPRAFAAGEKVVARMELQPVDAIVPAGGSLLLLVGQGNYGDGEAFRSTWYPGVASGPVEVWWGGEESTLALPVIERDGSTVLAMPWE